MSPAVRPWVHTKSQRDREGAGQRQRHSQERRKKERGNGRTNVPLFELRSQLRLQNKSSHNDRLAYSCSVSIQEGVELSRNSSLYTNWGCVLLVTKLIWCPLKYVALWGGQKGMAKS